MQGDINSALTAAAEAEANGKFPLNEPLRRWDLHTAMPQLLMIGHYRIEVSSHSRLGKVA